MFVFYISLYGLKHTPRAWFAKLSSSLLSFGFKCSQTNNSLFFHHTTTSLILLFVYVDDVVLTGNDLSFISQLITQLNNDFCLKDLSNLHYFLVIEVRIFSQGLFLNQTKYAHDLLVKTHMLNATKTNSPISHKPNPLPYDEHFIDPTRSLQYLTSTHPDLTYIVNLSTLPKSNH